MSSTLRKEILARLKEQYSMSSGRTDKERFENFLKYTSTEQIRKDTDTAKGRHESIMSRGAFQELARGLSNALQDIGLNAITEDTLKSDITFDNFKEYLINTVKLSLGKNTKRVAGDFTYQGVSRIGRGEGLTIATAKNREDADTDVLILRNIPIGNLVDYYSRFLAENLVTEGGNVIEVTKKIRSLFNAGHLTGAFNARLIRALGLRKNESGQVVFDTSNTTSSLSNAEVQLNHIMTLITDADYLSSNIVNDINLFVTTDKRLYKNKVELTLTTEVQFASLNKAAGNLLTQAGHAVSALTKAVRSELSESAQESAVETAISKLYANLKKLADEVKARATANQALPSRLRGEAQDNLNKILQNTDAIEKIIQSKGSKSIPEHIGYLVSNALQGLKASEEKSKAKVQDSLFKALSSKPSVAPIKVPKPKKLKAVFNPVRNLRGQFASLASLQNILNNGLAEAIQKNMGSGERKDILNYRTGRLAASAKVERMSQSREGMITAFYSYMRNPYGTFSEGGAQGSPRSRDPKLLISKSIREIAATQVSNRMRAVLA